MFKRAFLISSALALGALAAPVQAATLSAETSSFPASVNPLEFSAAFFADFETDDDGFVATGDWERGIPNGFDGAPFGGPEPVGGNSGDFVFGTVIGGAHNPSTVSDLTLGGVDLTDITSLSFFEFIDSGSSAFDTAQVLVGGVEIYLSDGGPSDGFREVTLDLSAFTGVSDIVWRFSATGVVERVGWYIDDVALSAGAPVPVPAAAPLMLAGLGALGLRRRRKQA